MEDSLTPRPEAADHVPDAADHTPDHVPDAGAAAEPEPESAPEESGAVVGSAAGDDSGSRSQPRHSRRVVRTSGAPPAGPAVAIDVPTATADAAPAPATAAVTAGSGTRGGRKATAAAGPPPPAQPADAAEVAATPDSPPPPAPQSPPGQPRAEDGAGQGEEPVTATGEEAEIPATGDETETPAQGGADSPTDTAGRPGTEATAPDGSGPQQASSPDGVPHAGGTPREQAEEAQAEGPERDQAGEPAAAGEDAPARRSGFLVLFQPPAPAEPTRRRAASRPAGPPPRDVGRALTFASPDEARPEPVKRPADQPPVEAPPAPPEAPPAPGGDAAEQTQDRPDEEDTDDGPRRRRRRGGRGRRRRSDNSDASADDTPDSGDDGDSPHAPAEDSDDTDDDTDTGSETDDSGTDDSDTGAGTVSEEDSETTDNGGSSSRRRRRRRRSSGENAGTDDQDPQNRARRTRTDEVTGVRGSTRLEAKRQRRREGRESGRRRHVLTEAEFLARRESVTRTMLVRERAGLTQIVVLEDGVLVEHYVARKAATSMIGNVYQGRVQNVLPSMEAAFVDIGKGRNAVLYAGEVNWDAAGLSGQPRRIELALKSGDPVLVQVSKDPIGHKGARLTSQISMPGRYLVYVPNSSITGISRKLPDTERARLKKILRGVVPEGAGVIVRTAAEGASEAELERDVTRLRQRWEQVSKRSGAVNPPTLLHSEPDLTIKVIRDVFNEDFKELVVSGEHAPGQVTDYVQSVAPDLADRVTVWDRDEDLFARHRVDEQISKALDRKVWLPSGGSLVIDRTEAMTVIDVNTGKFVGSGGNLEETVTRNNLEAAEEIVRQLRLRDVGGIIVIDFIDMVLEANRDLVLRRLVECLGRDRTKHQVAEVTSLGLVQMTRKRVGQGLLEAFSESCQHCAGRGLHIHDDLTPAADARDDQEEPRRHNEAAKVAQAARKAKERVQEVEQQPEDGDTPRDGAAPAAAGDRSQEAADAGQSEPV